MKLIIRYKKTRYQRLLKQALSLAVFLTRPQADIQIGATNLKTKLEHGVQKVNVIERIIEANRKAKRNINYLCKGILQ